jgi:hypothetical protein
MRIERIEQNEMRFDRNGMRNDRNAMRIERNELECEANWVTVIDRILAPQLYVIEWPIANGMFTIVHVYNSLLLGWRQIDNVFMFSLLW